MGRTRTSSDVELLVELDRDGTEPLHRQLEASLRSGIRDGRLAAGTILPSTRGLATQLRVSRGIVVEAYEQLVAEGFLDAKAGGATRVARGATSTTVVRADLAMPNWPFDFRPGRPDVTEFPRDTRSWVASPRVDGRIVPAASRPSRIPERRLASSWRWSGAAPSRSSSTRSSTSELVLVLPIEADLSRGPVRKEDATNALAPLTSEVPTWTTC